MKVKRIKVPFYKWKMISIIVESWDDKESVVKKMKSLQMRKEDIQEVSDMLDKEATDGGVCFYNNGRLLAVSIVYPTKTIKNTVSTLIHEGRHFADRIISDISLEGTEAAAYLTEFIIVEMISDYIRDETN